MAYGAPYYWTNVSDAIEFVATGPFGMNAMEQNAWCYYGGGIEAADKFTMSLVLNFYQWVTQVTKWVAGSIKK